ncbi:MAG: PH domain-containing protein [Thermoplasmata archaeon]|nr:PH domain-containing protein [Thermoplasmata archaeon]
MARKPKHISSKLLASNEKVLMESRQSAIKYMKGGAIAIILMIACLLLAFWVRLNLPELPIIQTYLEGTYGEYITYVLIGIGILFLIYFIVKWMRWSSTIYVMTNERVIIKKGIVGRDFEDMPLRMITNIDVSQSASQRALGYGTVIFSSQSGERDDLVWTAVPDPLKVRRLVQEVMVSGQG